MDQRLVLGTTAHGNQPPTPAAGLDYLMSINRPALEAMSEINSRMIEQVAALGSAWTQFVHKRLEQDFALPQQFATCKTPQDVMSVYGDWLQSALAHYQAEFAEMSRLGQSFGTEAATIVREKIEDVTRETVAREPLRRYG